jgi:hypothetical protein
MGDQGPIQAVSVPYDQAFPDALGRVVSNLVQLEFGLRIALHFQEPTFLPKGVLLGLSVGDELPENFLTNWHTLGELIKEFNSRERSRGMPAIDDGIVDLRDALAHGRMTMRRDTGTYHLVRFARPRNGRVLVESVQTLTMEWFDEQIESTITATNIVWARIEQLKLARGV